MFFWHGKAQASAMQQQVETHLQQVQPVQVIQFLYLPENGRARLIGEGAIRGRACSDALAENAALRGLAAAPAESVAAQALVGRRHLDARGDRAVVAAHVEHRMDSLHDAPFAAALRR